MKITLEVEEILVVTGRGPDQVTLVTNIRGTDISDDNESLSFKLPAGTGEAFVKVQFGVDPTRIVNLRRETVPFGEKRRENFFKENQVQRTPNE